MNEYLDEPQIKILVYLQLWDHLKKDNTRPLYESLPSEEHHWF